MAHAELLEVYSTGVPPDLVFHVKGALDMSTSSILRESVEPHLNVKGRAVIDLSAVTFCDSTGLGAIVGLYRTASAAGCSLFLRAPQRGVAAVLAMTGVDQVVTVINDPAG
jgi:anti-sigma B factor antagonist